MIEPIYSSEEHKQIIETYITMCTEFAKDVSSKTRYNNYLDVLDTILEYHNNYGKGVRENNWYDWNSWRHGLRYRICWRGYSKPKC